jgi:hypothetical protein
LILQKWLTFSNKDQFTSECLKKCENPDKQHINPLLRSEIQWLRRARLHNRVFLLKDEWQNYIQENSWHDFAKCFEVEKWQEKLSYLAFFMTTS